MITLSYSQEQRLFFTRCSFHERDIPKTAGFRWCPDARRWWTDDDRKAAALSAYADGAAKMALGRRDENLAASRAVEADITIPLPAGLRLYGFQRAGVKWVLERKSALIADEMGIGKTIQAIGLINTDPAIKDALVVCPKSVKLNWQRELDKWRTRPVRVTVVNYESLHKLAPQFWDLVVADECHFIKTPTARRTKALKAIKTKRKLALTGTPMLNRPIELWSTLHWLNPIEWPDQWGFGMRYCAGKKRRVSYTKEVWDFSGASHLDELQDKLRATLMIRRLKKDVLKELPEKTRQVIEISGADKLVKAEVEAAGGFEQAVRVLEAGAIGGISELAKLRHDLGLAKVDAALDHITDLLENGGKVIVFAHHRDVIAALADGLKAFNPAVITGETPMGARQGAVDSFQNDADCKVFIGSITASGVGITLTASDTVVFVEQDWTPGNMAQAEDRAHRIGQKNNVLVQYLVFDGSLDAHMAKMLVKKQAVADAALDNFAPAA